MGCGEIIGAKYSEMERKQTITCIKHVNQPVIITPQKTRLKVTKKKLLLRMELILKKDMETKKIKREKKHEK